MGLVVSDVRDAVGTIVLNHDEKRNALGEALIGEIVDALAAFSRQSIRAVVLRAAPGTKVWCAGHDARELPERGRDPLSWNDPLRVLVRALQEHSAPIIALVEGGVWGGGCEVVMACDMVVATPDVTFAITPAKFGIPYNLGGVLTLLNVIPQKVAKEMFYTAQPLPVARALHLGIVNHVKPAAEIETFTYSLAAEIAANAPLSIAVLKEQLRLLGGARAMSPEIFERIQGLRRIVYDSADYAEGLAAFRDKRKPRFTGK
jgi:methylmalonyl-CoA decarboxylase